MYRTVTLYSIENKIFVNDIINEEKLRQQINNIQIEFRLNPSTKTPETYLNGKNVENEIRSMQVSSRVSYISALPFVRKAMVIQLKEMGKARGIVMDGRDIGTVVFPDAELKIFVTASADTRAKRRFEELKAKGQNVTYEEILENVKGRDFIDQNRTASPLRKADNAILLDNGFMSLQQQKEWLLKQYNKVINL